MSFTALSTSQATAAPPGPPTDGSQSMTSILLEPLDTLQTLAQTLFASLGPPQSKPPPAPPVSALLACDDALAAAVQRARAHQARQRRIDALTDEILALEARWREICAELEQGARELEAMVVEGDERVKAIEKAKTAAVPYPELLAYAQSISAFTSAPPNMPDMTLPGQPPPPLFFPPFPNEEKMRRGRLNAEAPLVSSARRIPLVVVTPTKSPLKPPESGFAGSGAHSYRQETRPHQQVFDFDLDLNPDL